MGGRLYTVKMVEGMAGQGLEGASKHVSELFIPVRVKVP